MLVLVGMTEKQKENTAPSFFNDKRFQLIDNSTFWLSGTPEKPSVGWDAAMERICTYALLKDQQTNGYLYGYSIHTLIILGSLPERIVPI